MVAVVIQNIKHVSVAKLLFGGNQLSEFDHYTGAIHVDAHNILREIKSELHQLTLQS